MSDSGVQLRLFVEDQADPALKKLLANLPTGDPDKHELAEVWLEHTEAKVIVPIGVDTEVRLGPWCGPPTRLADVVLHARKVSTGERAVGRFHQEDWHRYIFRGLSVELVVFVEPF